MRISLKNLDKIKEKEYNCLCQKHGGVAQLGERTVRIRKVESSILFVSTRKTEIIAQAYGFCFFIQKRIEKGNCEAIETVRWTVSVPGCVPTVAVAGRAILFVSTRKKHAFACFFQ